MLKEINKDMLSNYTLKRVRKSTKWNWKERERGENMNCWEYAKTLVIPWVYPERLVLFLRTHSFKEKKNFLAEVISGWSQTLSRETETPTVKSTKSRQKERRTKSAQESSGQPQEWPATGREEIWKSLAESNSWVGKDLGGKMSTRKGSRKQVSVY